MKSDSEERSTNTRFAGAIVTLVTLTILLGVVGLFPIGLLALIASTGFFDILRGTEWEAWHVALIVFGVGTLIAITVYGLSKTRTSGSITVGVMFVLVLLNLSGCAAIWNDLSGIH